MRWCPVVLLAACSSDPTLSITVDHPAALVISSTEIAVYQSATLTCENIEFGDLDASQLAAIQVAEETISPPDPNTGSLDGLSREDHKVIVARGFNADALVSIGCAEQDAVSGNVQITIATNLAATVSIAPIDPGSGAADSLGRYVTTIDANGDSIDQRAVTWTVYGPAGTTSASGGDAVTSTIDGQVMDGVWQPTEQTLTCNGIATIHPVPPSTVAGYAVQVRVAWAAQSLPLYTAITPFSHPMPTTLSPPANVTRFCAVGRTGTTWMLGCIEIDAGNPTLDDLNLYGVGADGTVTAAPGNPVATLPGTIPNATRPIAALAIPTTGTDIDLYVVDTNGLATKLLGKSNVTGCSKALACNGYTFDDAIVLPPCGTSPAQIVFHGSGYAVYSMATTDNTVTQALPGTVGNNVLDGGGCATRIDPSMGSTSVDPVFEIDFVTALLQPTTSRAYYPCTGTGLCSVLLPVAGATLGFTGSDNPEMIVTNVTAAGAELDTSLIATIDNKDELLTLASEPALTAPDKIAVGQFDTDQAADAIWGMKLKAGTLLELSYARTVLGQPLETLASAALPIDLVDLATADINSDGIDDVIVLGTETNSGTPPKGAVLAIPIGVPAANGALMTDAQCQ